MFSCYLVSYFSFFQPFLHSQSVTSNSFYKAALMNIHTLLWLWLLSGSSLVADRLCQTIMEKTFVGRVSSDIKSNTHVQHRHTDISTHWKLLWCLSQYDFVWLKWTPASSQFFSLLLCAVWLTEQLVHEMVQHYILPLVFMSGSSVEQTFMIIVLHPHTVWIIKHNHRTSCV